MSKKILLVRSAPFETFKKVVLWLKKGREASVLSLLLQEDVESLVNQEPWSEIFLSPKGIISDESLANDVFIKLQSVGFDEMVIPCRVVKPAAYKNLLKLAVSLNIPLVLLRDKEGQQVALNKSKIGALLIGNDESGETSKPFRSFPNCFPPEFRAQGMPQAALTWSTNKPRLFSFYETPEVYTFELQSILAVKLKREEEHDLSKLTDSKKVTIPVCLPLLDSVYYGEVKFQVDNEEIKIERLLKGRWHFFTFDSGSKNISISSQGNDIILGDPVFHASKTTKKNNPKCVALIILDGLCWLPFEDAGLEEVMPNTSKMFKDGRIFKNYWAQSEWSLPCVASMFTGLYPSNHGLYQPFSHTTLPEISTLPELFQESGYLTFCHAPAARWINPLYGHTRGFNRFYSYPQSHPLYDDRLAIHETIEQLKAFPERSHFVYLHLFRIHGVEPPLWSFSNQVKCKISDRRYRASDNIMETSSPAFHPEFFERYILCLRQADDELKVLFDQINDSYGEDAVVALTADHGFSHLGKVGFELADHQLHVPSFIKAPALEKGFDDTLVTQCDLFNNLLHLSGISPPKDRDGKLWKILGGTERTSILSESAYMNSYKLSLRNKEWVCRVSGTIKNGSVLTEGLKKDVVPTKGNDKGFDANKDLQQLALDHINSLKGRINECQ